MLVLFEKGFRIVETGLAFARGSPSMVKGVGLRLPSLRGSWVQIPPPALFLFRKRQGLLFQIDFGIPKQKTTTKGGWDSTGVIADGARTVELAMGRRTGGSPRCLGLLLEHRDAPDHPRMEHAVVRVDPGRVECVCEQSARRNRPGVEQSRVTGDSVVGD